MIGANVHFSKYFDKYAMIAREEKFPEIYHTHDRILLFVSALYGSAHAALVDAQHQRRLNDVGQRLHLLVAEHGLEHGEHALRRG